MTSDNPIFFIILAILSIIFFVFSLFWAQNIWILLLAFILVIIFAASFFWPRASFIALIILRTATDFLTGQEMIALAGWSINFTSLTGVVAIIFAFSVFFKEKSWREKIPLFWPWASFLLLGIIAIFYSISMTASLVELLRWLSFASLFFLGFALFRGGKQTTSLIKALIAASFIPVFVACLQFINDWHFFDGERWRISGTFVHPNMLAFYLLFIITLSIFLFLTLKKETIEKYFYLFLIPILIMILGLTYTRGAWLALLMITIFIGLFRFRIFLLYSLFIISLSYFLINPFQERINSVFSFSASDSTVWRLELWKDAMNFGKKNIYFGNGPGTAPIIIAQYRSSALGSTEPHNDYVKIFLEIGLAGLLIYLILLFSLFKNLLLGFKYEIWPRRRLLFLFMFIFAIVLYLSSAGDNILKDSSLQWSFWALIGALMYSYAHLNKTSKNIKIKSLIKL